MAELNPSVQSAVDGVLSSSSSPSIDPSALLLRRNTGYMVSLGTCSKLCAAGFIAGVIVGYTLKRRVRNWASKILRRLKDD
ncbi:hypothetical protein ACHQM5_029312 [Ranunculus cassubicifolius]